MTTFAPGQDVGQRIRDIDEQVREAWSAYRVTLVELDGAEYDEAEQRCWERLQRKLSQCAEDRRALGVPALGPR